MRESVQSCTVRRKIFGLGSSVCILYGGHYATSEEGQKINFYNPTKYLKLASELVMESVGDEDIDMMH